jgi:hypothetical protein
VAAAVLAQQDHQCPQQLQAAKAAQAVNSQRFLDTGNQQRGGSAVAVPAAVILTVLLA